MSAPDDRLARATSKLLKRALPDPPPASANARMRGIIAVEEAMADARRRRYGVRVVLPIAAAATVLLAFGVVGALRRVVPREAARTTAPAAASARVLGGDVVLMRGASQLPLAEPTALVAGDRVVNGIDGRVGVTFTSGTHVLLEERADVAFTSLDLTQSLFLGAGAVRADVAKLGPRERFIVRTADGEVEVRGTSFRVTTTTDASCRATTVAVYEGRVVVRFRGSESSIAANQQWSSGCSPQATSAAPEISATKVEIAPLAPAASVGKVAPSAPASVSAATPEPPPVASSAPSVAASVVSSPSELVEQNNMFAAGIAAKKRGDAAAAVSSFDALLAKYPSCALAEQASVERFRALASYDRKRAIDAARDYLNRYPYGYARSEANTIIEGGS